MIKRILLGHTTKMNASFIVRKSKLKNILKGGDISNCQQNMDEQIDKYTKWIDLVKVLQNLDGKGIATMIAKIKTSYVVVKVNLKINSDKEYIISQRLENINGFLKYHCIFYCHGSKEYIEKYGQGNVSSVELCENKGNSMGIIVMPYYKNGSLEENLKNKKLNLEQLKNILIKVIQNYINAYEKLNFVHCDFFSKNIILDDNNEPIIIDFELSNFESSSYWFFRDIQNLIEDIQKNYKNINFHKIYKLIIINLAYNNVPSNENMKEIIDRIKEL